LGQDLEEAAVLDKNSNRFLEEDFLYLVAAAKTQ
jgi:hypothetical protein